jgi:transcriptional regulator with XRE-family HTH domain
LRLERGWSQKKVATKAGMTATTYGRIEKGSHTLTSQLQAIADVFLVPIDAVLVPGTAGQPSEFEALVERKVREQLAQLRDRLDTARHAPTTDEDRRQWVEDVRAKAKAKAAAEAKHDPRTQRVTKRK